MDGWTYRLVRNVDIVPTPDRPGFPHRQRVSLQPAARAPPVGRAVTANSLPPRPWCGAE